MAGSYPDVPSRRMAIDADGTIGLYALPQTDPYSEYAPAAMAEINDEDNTTVTYQSGAAAVGWYAFIFPELREIDGIFSGCTSAGHITLVETSADTTNGRGGTWATLIADLNPSVNTYPNYRDDIQSTAASSKRSIRFTIAAGANSIMQSIHLYGEIAALQTPDRLLIIDEATGLEFTAAYDYGDIPRGSSDDDLELRFKNNSATLTATTNQYTAEDLYLGSGNWYLFTTPGGSTFSSTQALASLSPGSSSGLVVCRRVSGAAETLGLHAGRFYVNTDTWV